MSNQNKPQAPNYNASNQFSMAGILEEVLKNYSLTLENCLPAVVVSHDRAANTVVVTPAIKTISTDGEANQRANITLPVHVFGGGGIVISTPLKQGDTGWIVACDRDITLFKQSLKVSNPNTYRTHKLSFGFFIPDKVKGFTVSGGDTNAFLIQTLDGSTKIALSDGLVEIKTGGDIKAECTNLTITASSCKITATTDIIGDTTITGNLSVSSAITATGAITGTGVKDITIPAGVTLGTHTHGSPAVTPTPTPGT